jgi:hypothetical protein
VASQSDDTVDFLKRFKDLDAPKWSTPTELGQLSLDAMAASDTPPSHDKDAEEVSFVGVLHTISDTTPWELQVEEGDKIYIYPGDISSTTAAALHVGQRVRIRASARVIVLSDGTEWPEYTALEVVSLENQSS